MIDTLIVRVPFSGGVVDMTKGVCAVCGHDIYEKNPSPARVTR